jgi:predicted Zn-dependent peptidase
VTTSDRTATIAATDGHRTAEAIGRTEVGPRPVPPLGITRDVPLPAVEERTLASGLRVLVVRRPSVPMVEMRLRIPFADRAGTAGPDASHPARSELLAETLRAGTRRHDRFDLDDQLAALGADLSASVDPERLLVSGSALSAGLPEVLDVLADLLTAAAYPDAEVGRERDRLVERLTVARAQPRVIAREALQRSRFGDHPVSREIPQPEDVARVAADEVRALHRGQVVPAGSTLVIVGDLDPGAAFDQTAGALDGWVSDQPASQLPPPVHLPGGDLQLVHRPRSVQSNLRLSAPAVPRDHPRYPALLLANLVFGGYFSSRLVENLREDKGYTYHASSGIEFVPAGAALTVETDTATEVTAAALLETRYELARMVVVPPTQEEIDSAREYAIGSLLISLDNQGGLASTLSALLAAGLDVEWLRSYPARLADVTTADVAAAALEFLTPARFTGVVLGDADATGRALEAIGGIAVP